MISINYEGSHGQAHGCVKNCPPLWVVKCQSMVKKYTIIEDWDKCLGSNTESGERRVQNDCANGRTSLIKSFSDTRLLSGIPRSSC